MTGYDVIDFCNGVEALRFAREHSGPVHLLLTDVVMPGISGRELANNLVQIHPETCVLFISGYSVNTIHHHGVLDEGVNLLPKPFTRSSPTQKSANCLVHSHNSWSGSRRS